MNYPKFIDKETFYSLHSGLTELETVKHLSENLKLIHNLTTAYYDDFNVLIRDYISAGLSIFDMEIGIVSHIQGDDYIVCDAISPENSLAKGDKFELEGTYCREVIKSAKVLGFPHVGAMESLKNHPVYENMKLESYISAPIVKEGKIFGTLNFSSTKIRKHGFSETEKELITMLAGSISTFLLLKEKEEKLENANKRIRKLTGYVAHDLRSPLGGIISIIDMLPLLDEDEKNEMLGNIKKSADKSLEMIHTILEAAIFGDGKITLEKGSYSLKDLLMEILVDYKSKIDSSELKLSLNCIDTKLLLDKERMLQVLSNLVSNCIKYAKRGSVVNINILEFKGRVRFEVQNEMNSEKEKLTKVDVSEESSIGYGLEIVQEILKLHDSEYYFSISAHKYSGHFDL